MRLKDKVCLVTDCAVMDGPAIAAEFLGEGAHLVLQAPDRGLAKRELAKDVVGLDGIQWIEADFAERGVAEREIARLVARTGKLDVLVNNDARRHRQAGGEPFVDMDDAEVTSIVDKARVRAAAYDPGRASAHGRGPIRQDRELGVDWRGRRVRAVRPVMHGPRGGSRPDPVAREGGRREGCLRQRDRSELHREPHLLPRRPARR